MAHKQFFHTKEGNEGKEKTIIRSNTNIWITSKKTSMSSIKIKYGDKEISLEKSKNLIGLKKATTRGITKDPSKGMKQIEKDLGGFEVLKSRSTGARLERKLDKLREEDSVEVGTHVYQTEGNDAPLIPTGEIYIMFQEGTNVEEHQIVFDEYHLEVIKERGEGKYVVTVTPNSPNPIKVAAALQESFLIKLAEPDLAVPIEKYFTMPSDDLLKYQWYFDNKGNVPDTVPIFKTKEGADAKIVDAWRKLGSLGDPNIIVAVIDDGFDLEHPDLKNKVVAPFDALTGTNLSPLNDDDTHGTPCAGVAVGEANGSGIVGVAPNAQFLPCSHIRLDAAIIDRCLEHCMRSGADVISCSWGSTHLNMSALTQEVIKDCAEDGRGGKGCVILFAAGNDHGDFVNFYSTHPDVICVGASTAQDEHANYSNKGAQVWVCAPSDGQNSWGIIAPKVPFDHAGWIDNVPKGAPGKYRHFGGTSSATPLVAGVCALILSANPNLTAKEVKNILRDTADKIGEPWEYDQNGHSRKYGYGRVNAAKAVTEAIRIGGGLPTTPNTGTVNNNGGGTTSTPGGNTPTTNTENGNTGVRIEPTDQPLPLEPTPDPFEGDNDFLTNTNATPLRFKNMCAEIGYLNGSGSEQVFIFRGAANTLSVELKGPENLEVDFDLFIRRGNPPVPNSGLYDFSATQLGAEERMVVDDLPRGDYYIMVKSFRGAGQFLLKIVAE